MPKPDDQGIAWMCSLRQNDEDLVHDGFKSLKKSKKQELEDRMNRENESLTGSQLYDTYRSFSNLSKLSDIWNT